MSKRYSPKLKFQIVLELLQGDKTVGQVAKAYGVHPNTASAWKRTLLEKGPEIFAKDGTVAVNAVNLVPSPDLIILFGRDRPYFDHLMWPITPKTSN